MAAGRWWASMRFWLPVAVVGAACASLWRPAPGAWLVDSGALDVMIPAAMFFISLRVDATGFAAAIRRPLPILVSLVMVYGVFPPIAFGMQRVFGPDTTDGWTAMTVLASQPSTLATAAVLTAIAGGNAATALVCTTACQALSPAMTPLIVRAWAGAAVSIDVAALALDLARSVVLPVVAAQGVRLLAPRRIDRAAGLFHVLAEAVVVGFVLAGFSRARGVLSADPAIVAAAAATVAAIHVVMAAIAATLGVLLLRSPADRVAFTFVSVHKTLPAGILVWKSAFGTNPIGPMYLVLHHLLQTVAGALLAPRMTAIRIAQRRPFGDDRGRLTVAVR